MCWEVERVGAEGEFNAMVEAYLPFWGLYQVRAEGSHRRTFAKVLRGTLEDG